MRVVAGEARGRRLVAPADDSVRPTTDRVREAMFNALGSLGCVVGARVLDLFAGTGALGIEALSRGALSCTFVDSDPRSVDLVEKNLRATGLGDTDRAQVVRSTADTFLGSSGHLPFDLVLLDPPYALRDWPDLLVRVAACVNPRGVIVTESDREIDAPQGWRILRSRRYGGTVVGINVHTAQPPEPAK